MGLPWKREVSVEAKAIGTGGLSPQRREDGGTGQAEEPPPEPYPRAPAGCAQGWTRVRAGRERGPGLPLGGHWPPPLHAGPQGPSRLQVQAHMLGTVGPGSCPWEGLAGSAPIGAQGQGLGVLVSRGPAAACPVPTVPGGLPRARAGGDAWAGPPNRSGEKGKANQPLAGVGAQVRLLGWDGGHRAAGASTVLGLRVPLPPASQRLGCPGGRKDVTPDRGQSLPADLSRGAGL